MIVDTDGTSCVNVNFGIGGGTANTQRQWDIMVSIYRNLPFMTYLFQYFMTTRPLLLSTILINYFRPPSTDAVTKMEVSIKANLFIFRRGYKR